MVARTTGSRTSAILPVGVLAGVGDRVDGAVLHRHLVDDVGRRRDQVEVGLALEPLADDVHVQQAEEAAAEAEAEGTGGLGLVAERRVVELELVEGLAEVGVVVAVDRVQPGEDHRVGVLVATERRGRAVVLTGDGVADPRLADVLDAGDQVADLADPEVAGLDRLGADHADLEHLVDRAGRHHLDPVAVAEPAVHDPDVGDDSAVGVVDGVEDQGPRRCVRVTDRRWGLLDDLVEDGGDALAGLGADAEHLGGVAADDAGELLGVLLGVGAGQVDLVEHRDDVEVGAQREIEVGEGLRLDALGGVDEEHGGLARRQRSRDLVGEVDVPRGVDHVEHVGAGLRRPARCRPGSSRASGRPGS